MFTKNQLEYLTRVQATDDWHCSCFVDVLRQYHDDPVNEFIKEVQLSQTEFNNLIVILNKAKLDDIWHLQMALNHLNQMPYEMFEVQTELRSAALTPNPDKYQTLQQ